MTLKIHMTGEVLRDADNIGKRNYANLLVWVYEGSKALSTYHIINYAISARSLKHKTIVSQYEVFEEANTEYMDRRKRKLARNRVVHQTFDHNFETPRELEEFLPSNGIRLPMVEAKKLAATIGEFMAGMEKPFEDRMKDELAKADDPVERERALGIGKETAKINKGWGMF